MHRTIRFALTLFATLFVGCSKITISALPDVAPGNVATAEGDEPPVAMDSNGAFVVQPPPDTPNRSTITYTGTSN